MTDDSSLIQVQVPPADPEKIPGYVKRKIRSEKPPKQGPWSRTRARLRPMFQPRRNKKSTICSRRICRPLPTRGSMDSKQRRSRGINRTTSSRTLDYPITRSAANARRRFGTTSLAGRLSGPCRSAATTKNSACCLRSSSNRQRPGVYCLQRFGEWRLDNLRGRATRERLFHRLNKKQPDKSRSVFAMAQLFTKWPKC
jgi:hypothetical protein